MHTAVQPVSLPLPLAFLRDTEPGAIYAFTTKDNLLQGLAACQREVVAGTEWMDEKRVLTIKLATGHRIAFTAVGNQLTMRCGCGGGGPIGTVRMW